MKNIVMILIDAFRSKNLSLFGYNKETDKYLTKIAKESILFREHFSASNSTAPAITSIFTGKYPNNHGVIHQLPYTRQEEIEKIKKAEFWLPEYLGGKGYETVAIDWIGFWFTRGFDYYGEGDKDASALFNPANEITDLAISKIKQAKRPFFLFLHFWDTHFPFPTTEYDAMGKEGDLKKTLESIKSESQREYLKKRIDGTGLYTIWDMKNKYDMSIKSIDKEIGRLHSFLKGQGLWDETVFILLGDHGENLTDHGIYFSSSGLYDDSIHVPLIMHIPGFKAGEVTELVQNVDITPTILDYLKLEAKGEFDGISLLPLIKSNRPVRDRIFSFDGLCADITAVRTKTRKLIIAKDNFCNLCKASHHGKIEEYDLEDDPEETINVYSKGSKLTKPVNTTVK